MFLLILNIYFEMLCFRACPELLESPEFPDHPALPDFPAQKVQKANHLALEDKKENPEILDTLAHL